MSDICPIWTAIIQNVRYSPHPWDNAREGTLTGVSDAVNVIREEIARHAAQARLEALEEAADLIEGLDGSLYADAIRNLSTRGDQK